MNSIGWVTLTFLLALVLLAPSRWALLGIFGGVLYMTIGQVVDVAGLHIFPTRVLTLAAFVRVLIRGEWSVVMLNGIDKILILTFFYQTAVFILNGNGSPINSSINMIGQFADVILAYFTGRGFLRSFEDLEWFLRALVFMLVPYVIFLYVESSTGSNPFAAIGGIAHHEMREGRVRCVGSFVHASILGTFGGGLIPLFIALSLRGASRAMGILGVLLCLAIVLFSNSGGPATCVMLAVVGWLFWFLRTKMPTVRVSIFWGLVVLGFVMKAPLWYLPVKLSAITGGDGWHRSYLMDVAFRNLDRWWLAGMSVLETKDWFPYTVVTGGADIINYYLCFGIAAGVVAIVLFCYLLVRAFSCVGNALAAVRMQASSNIDKETMLWALGVMLLIHVFNWFGLVYFDQYNAIFFIQLAVLSTLSHKCIEAQKTPVKQETGFALGSQTASVITCRQREPKLFKQFNSQAPQNRRAKTQRLERSSLVSASVAADTRDKGNLDISTMGFNRDRSVWRRK
jgi:hypothetical protein